MIIFSKFCPNRLYGSRFSERKVTSISFKSINPINPIAPTKIISEINPKKAGKLLKKAFIPSENPDPTLPEKYIENEILINRGSRINNLKT